MSNTADPSFDPDAVAIRPASTVMLVRDVADGAPGIEVFMLQRTLKAAFAGGMYVFPGGRVDLADGAAAMEAVCDGLTDDAASELLQIESGGLAFWVAAIRECFEEAGVLLARSATDGDVVRFDDPAVAARFTAVRPAIHDSSQICRREGGYIHVYMFV